MSTFNLFDSAFPENEPSDRRVYSVTELTREIKRTLESEFPCLWVEGEISNFKRHSSGHCYFSLKDAEAQLSCVLWRGRSRSLIFEPEDGMKVRLYGSVTLYEKQGRYQLDVEQIMPAGIGELQMAFEALKRRLEAEGLFDPAHKKPVPLFPGAIGLVTSPTGAAVRDMVSVIRRRQPGVQLILRPVRVQGPGAAEEIAAAIAAFNAWGGVDLIIAGRGGGSLEDLWAFNEEAVARAIFHSRIPVISAVGHEIDFSISDFTADLRAPTPSAAAELAVRDREELNRMLMQSRDRMIRFLGERIGRHRERLVSLERSYGLRWPADRMREYRQRLDDAGKALERNTAIRLEREQARLRELKGKLESLNPEAVLQRGYSIVTRSEDGAVVRGSGQIQPGDEVRLRFSTGGAAARIEGIDAGE